MQLRFAFRKGHPNFRAICKELNAEFVQIQGPDISLKYGKYFYPFQIPISMLSSFFKTFFVKKSNDVVYLCAGTQPMWFPLFMRWIWREKNKIIMFSGEAAIDLQNKGGVAKRYLNFLFKRVNGVIAVSPLIANMAKSVMKCPVKYYIDSNYRGYKYFEKITPDLRSENFVHVGKFQMVKGIDLTAKMMGYVCDSLNVKFFILGRDMDSGLKKMNLDNNHFVYTGYVDPLEYLAKSAFYVQLARLEASGTSVLEAMAAGLIPFVNKNVGHVVLVEKVSPDLVISEDPKTAANQIIAFVKKTSVKKLTEMSKLCRDLAKNQDVPKVAKIIEKKIDEIIKG